MWVLARADAAAGELGMNFKLRSNYQPRGDQPAAIEQLTRGLEAGDKNQVSLGVTGSGKTFTMAKGDPVGEFDLRLSWRTTRRSPRSCTMRFKGILSRRTRSNISSATTIFTSRKRTYPPLICASKSSTINDELDKLRMSATGRL